MNWVWSPNYSKAFRSEELPSFFNYHFHSRFPKFEGFGLKGRKEEEERIQLTMNMDGPLDFENEDLLVNPPPSADKRSFLFYFVSQLFFDFGKMLVLVKRLKLCAPC